MNGGSSHEFYQLSDQRYQPWKCLCADRISYTMVYGIAKMLNFAHGDVIMVGAFITYTMCSTMGLSPVIGVLAAVIACTCWEWLLKSSITSL